MGWDGTEASLFLVNLDFTHLAYFCVFEIITSDLVLLNLLCGKKALKLFFYSLLEIIVMHGFMLYIVSKTGHLCGG